MPSESAFETARVFVKYIVCRWGCTSQILSDKAPGYISVLLATIGKLLGLKHRFSAAIVKRSNGKSEAMIKKVNAGLRLYSTPTIDDRYIEIILPVIELSLNASADAVTKISPFKICHGFDMNFATVNSVDIPEFISPDTTIYVKWLQNSIKLLHDGVREKNIDYKRKMKEKYDKSHNARTPRFAVGDLALIRDTRVPAGSNRVLTKRPYESGLYLIKEVVSNDSIGAAYKAVDRETGKEARLLITHDRLKAYLDPSGGNAVPALRNEQRVKQFTDAQCILRTKVIHNRRKYLILFRTQETKWCDVLNVGRGLITDYHRNKE